MLCYGLGELTNQTRPQLSLSSSQLPVSAVHLWNLARDLHSRGCMAQSYG